MNTNKVARNFLFIAKITQEEKNEEKSQKISKTSEVDFSAPGSHLPMDKYNGTKSPDATINNQRFLEIKPGEDIKPCIWCVNYWRLRCQERIVCNPEKE